MCVSVVVSVVVILLRISVWLTFCFCSVVCTCFLVSNSACGNMSVVVLCVQCLPW